MKRKMLSDLRGNPAKLRHKGSSPARFPKWSIETESKSRYGEKQASEV
jgi:hypothetical protein